MPRPDIGYCTNVHAGATLEAMKANLERHAVAVRARLGRDEPLPIGLWLCARAAADVLAHDGVADLRIWLERHGLRVFTINGFPHDDFHQPVVKHAVYRPDWTTDARRDYTIDLIDILDGLLPEGAEGSISTLPLGWPTNDFAYDRAADQLMAVAAHAARVSEASDRLLHIDLEPEPGCLLQRSSDVTEFFTTHLLSREDHDLARRHLRVCHDVCHAAVMFEDQAEMLQRYADAGVAVGKVQVSSAVRAPLAGRSDIERTETLAALRAFSEDRYLHQTVVRDGEHTTFYEDLPLALDDWARTDRAGDEWRTHFHVPIDLESFGPLRTTRTQIERCVDLLRDDDVRHWEVETYAWDVLPEHLQVTTLADGIARELTWFTERVHREGDA